MTTRNNLNSKGPSQRLEISPDRFAEDIHAAANRHHHSENSPKEEVMAGDLHRSGWPGPPGACITFELKGLWLSHNATRDAREKVQRGIPHEQLRMSADHRRGETAKRPGYPGTFHFSYVLLEAEGLVLA